MEIAVIGNAAAADVRELFINAVMSIQTSIYTQEQKLAWIKDANDHNFWQQYLLCNNVLGTWNNDKQLLGFLSYQPLRCYVDMLFVTPNMQRKGIANRLWQALLAYYYPINQPRIFTHASEVAKPFFNKVGFLTLQERKIEKYTQQLNQYWMMRPSNKNSLIQDMI